MVHLWMITCIFLLRMVIFHGYVKLPEGNVWTKPGKVKLGYFLGYDMLWYISMHPNLLHLWQSDGRASRAMVKVRVNPGNFTEGPEPEIIRDRCEIGAMELNWLCLKKTQHGLSVDHEFSH